MKKYMNGNLKNPNFFLFIAIFFSAIVLYISGKHTYRIMEDVLENSKQAQIERSYINDIPFFDEVLTNSALLAATTGDAQWEKRYRLVEPKLDNDIKYLIRLDTLNNLHKMLRLTDNANVSLVAMENRVFELVRDGKQNEAITIMKGSEYARQKAFYSEGLTTFIKLHELETEQLQMRLHKEADHSKWFFGLAILLLAIVWVPIERFLRKSRAQMLLQNQELELQITERKINELKINELKTNLELILNAVGEGIYGLDKNGNITFVNKAFETIIGWKSEEIIGKPMHPLIHHSKPDGTSYPLEQCPTCLTIKEGRIFRSDNEYYLRKDGSGFFIEFVSTPIIKNDKVDGAVVIFKDITERRLAEEKLKESEEKYRILAESSPEMIYLIDTKGYVTYVNKVAAAQFHAPAQELIGKHLKDIFPPELAQRNLAGIRDVIATKSNFQSEVEMVFPTGNRWVDARLTPVFDEKNQVIGVLGLSFDITERRRAEKSVAALSQRYQILLQTASDGIHVLDDQGNVVEVNTAFCTMLGYTREELLQLNVADWDMQWVGNELLAKVNELFMHPFVFETRHRRKDGTFLDVEINVVSITLEGRNYTYSAARDITERRRAEAEIKKTNAALTKLNAEKDKFFSIIAHDLKTPFNSIIGFSEILVEQVKEKNYQGIEEYTGIILQSSQRAMDLLMNLMEWSRSQTGKMEFNPAYFEMAELINEVELLLTNAAGQKSIVITNTLPDNIAVYADRNMMSAVLRNLISNAIKFTRPGGEIIISVEEKEELTVSVSDNGVGIPKDRIEQLFRIDENYSTYGTQNERGTGLGLILCKEFIEKHGGKIWVESEEGKGSVFYFTIP